VRIRELQEHRQGDFELLGRGDGTIAQVFHRETFRKLRGLPGGSGHDQADDSDFLQFGARAFAGRYADAIARRAFQAFE
jgi:hypothetical protein